jgi:CRISPR-associated protein (TIGR02584 family)
MRQILLSIVGGTPAVLTETLWAIAQEERPWPEQIYVITTTYGAKLLRETVLNEGVIARLSKDVQRPCPVFSGDDIWIVPDAQGREIEDARTPTDHEALANYIMTAVRNLTCAPDTAVHASLAGGRKTMTYYQGDAMSLFGRVQDSLSHVLVSKDFENRRGFFYPTNDDEQQQAAVTLADIPFIRHRHNLPPVFAASEGKPENSAQFKPEPDKLLDFRRLVNLINLGSVPERIRLEIDVPRRIVRVRDAETDLKVQIQPGLLELAFYLMLARATQKNKCDITRPDPGKEDKKKGDRPLAHLLCNELLLLVGKTECDTLEKAVDALRTQQSELRDQISEAKQPGEAQALKQALLRPGILDSLEDNGILNSWFSQRLNTLKDFFAMQLPDVLVQAILPKIIWDKDGRRVTSGQTQPQRGGYGIALPETTQIKILP